MGKRKFEGVKDTLFIPLTARIYVSRRFPEYFRDPGALALEDSIPGDRIARKSNEYQMIVSAARYRNLDEMVLSFASKHPACNVVALGCGLDTQFSRIGSNAPQARFYELDLPEVIEHRRRILGESERDSLIAGDLFDLEWADGLDRSLPTIMTASGVFQYFRNADVVEFISHVRERFSDAELIFDATNSSGLKYANRYVRKTGNASAIMHCAVDDPAAFAREAGCELVECRPFFIDARRILKGRVSPYTRIAMYVCDKGNRAFLLHLKMRRHALEQ